MAEEGKTLGQLVADLQAEYGEHQYGRIDLHIPDDVKNAAIARARALQAGDTVFAGMPILRQENLDGVKFYLDNPEAKTKPNAAETWLLLRASGTEPLMRIYTESCSKESVAKLLESAREFALCTGKSQRRSHVHSHLWISLEAGSHQRRQAPRQAGDSRFSQCRSRIDRVACRARISRRAAQGYTFAGMMKFTSKAACDAYTTHPAHEALLEWLVPLIDPVELDFEA